jgi:hypothetical protein
MQRYAIFETAPMLEGLARDGCVFVTAAATPDQCGHARRAIDALEPLHWDETLHFHPGEVTVAPPCSTQTIGLRLMREAGYDPDAMVSVMQKLEQASGGSRQPPFAGTHAGSANRIACIREQLAKPVQ